MMITPTTDPSAATLSPVERPTRHWRHVGRGSEYVEIGRGLLQQSGRSLFENDVIVAYRGSDGKIWFREQDEFEDGRFVEISPAEPSVTPAPIEPGVIEALEIIAGKRQCADNLMSHADVARAALAALPKPAPAGADPCLQGPGTTPPFAIPRDPNFRAPATADTVPVSREIRTILEVARLGLHHSNTALRAEIDRLLAEGAR